MGTPASRSASNVGRTLIVGDVHGCQAELEALLSEVSFKGDDKLVFVGDLVARGPDSLGVLELARRLNAKSVQGNHERKLLQAYEAESNGQEKVKLASGHRQLMRQFKSEHWDMLRRMPVYLELPEHDVCVVHAGMMPGIPMSRQDPWVMTHIRSIDEAGRPSTELGHTLWASTYRGPPHVVFGHSSQVGLQLHQDATGLDSGCVYGARLTGLLLAEKQQVPTRERREAVMVSVPARNVYYRPGTS